MWEQNLQYKRAKETEVNEREIRMKEEFKLVTREHKEEPVCDLSF